MQTIFLHQVDPVLPVSFDLLARLSDGLILGGDVPPPGAVSDFLPAAGRLEDGTLPGDTGDFGSDDARLAVLSFDAGVCFSGAVFRCGTVADPLAALPAFSIRPAAMYAIPPRLSRNLVPGLAHHAAEDKYLRALLCMADDSGVRAGRLAEVGCHANRIGLADRANF